MEYLFGEIYEVHYQVHSLEGESKDALGNSQEFVDKRTIFTLHPPPISQEKLSEEFAPRKVEILAYSKRAYLP